MHIFEQEEACMAGQQTHHWNRVREAEHFALAPRRKVMQVAVMSSVILHTIAVSTPGRS